MKLLHNVLFSIHAALIRTNVLVDYSHRRADTLLIMNAALAYQPECEEVAVVSIEVLDANVSAMRGELTELKTDFKAHRGEFTGAISRLDEEIKRTGLRLDNDIKAAVAELRAEIRAVAAKAASDLKDFADRVERQFAELRTQIDGTNARLDATNTKLDATNARLDVTNDRLTDLSKSMNHLSNKLNAMFWVIGGLMTIAVFVITVGKAVGWF